MELSTSTDSCCFYEWFNSILFIFASHPHPHLLAIGAISSGTQYANEPLNCQVGGFHHLVLDGESAQVHAPLRIEQWWPPPWQCIDL